MLKQILKQSPINTKSFIKQKIIHIHIYIYQTPINLMNYDEVFM